MWRNLAFYVREQILSVVWAQYEKDFSRKIKTTRLNNQIIPIIFKKLS